MRIATLVFTAFVAVSGAVLAQSSTTVTPPPTVSVPSPEDTGKGLKEPASGGGGPLGYPGSTWGAILYPSGNVQQEKHNVLLIGKVEQGINWFKFGGNQWLFNTYASFNYSTDNKGLAYNNKVTPAVGVKVRRLFGDIGILDLGVQGYYERRWKEPLHNDKNTTGVQAYASWWFGWDLKK